LAATLTETYRELDVEYIPSGGGVFEVTLDGRLIYSKKVTGRHPTHEEILRAIG
jgi:selenoprotein W-related protein